MTTVDPGNDSAALATSDHLVREPGPPVPASRAKSARTEMIIGAVLVLLVAAGGLYFEFRPDQGVVDGWFSIMETSGRSHWLSAVTLLRYPMVVVVGAIVAAAVCFRRDRPRAWACLIGPPLALVTSELVAKPLVGRTLGGVFSYPSGSTVGATALATAAALAAPLRWRVVTIVVASLYALWMAAAVVALQWHYPTDALAGLAYGVGVVLLADGLAWKVAGRLRHRPIRHRPPVVQPAAESRSPVPPVV